MEGNSQARVSPSIIHERLLICTHGHESCWGGILAGRGDDKVSGY